MVSHHAKKGDYHVDLCFSKLIDKLYFYKMVKNEAFSMKPKHQFHLFE